jgi:hypothetical protein
VTWALKYDSICAIAWGLVAMTIMLGMNELRAKLEELRTEHRDLDEVIQRLAETAPFNQLQIQRLKKRKLVLKDLITQIESKLLPDIIA